MTVPAVPAAASPAPVRPGWGTGRRGLAVAVVLAALGGATAALSGTQRWATGTVTSVLNAVPVAVDGGAAAPLATAGGLLGLAAVGALLATRTTGRVVVGLLLVAAAVGTAAAGTGFLRDPDGARFTTAGADGVGVAVTSPGTPGQVHVSAWPWLTCAASLLLLAAGVSATLRGRRWPALGRRYEAPADRGADRGVDRATAVRTPAAAPARRPGPAVIWDDLDAGRDPTDPAGDADPADSPPGR